MTDDKKGDTFDFSGQNVETGEGGQVNQGNVSNPSVTNTFGDKSDAVEKFFESLAVAMKEDAPDTEDDWQPPMDQLKTMAMAGPPAAEEVVEVEKEAEGIISKLKPHASTIARVVGTFSAEALKCLASSNPVVSGVIAVAQDLRN